MRQGHVADHDRDSAAAIAEQVAAIEATDASPPPSGRMWTLAFQDQ
jgi:hypothetical protein